MLIKDIIAYSKTTNGNIAVVESTLPSPTPFIVVKNLNSLQGNTNASWDFAYKYWTSLDDAMNQFNELLPRLAYKPVDQDKAVEEFMKGLTYQVSAEEAIKILIRDEIYAHDVNVAHDDIGDLVNIIYVRMIGSEENTIFSSYHYTLIDKAVESYGSEHNYNNTLFV